MKNIFIYKLKYRVQYIIESNSNVKVCPSIVEVIFVMLFDVMKVLCDKGLRGLGCLYIE